MSDIIYRQDAVSKFSDLLMLDLKGQRIPTWEEVYNAMQDLPPAEPEIIHCKDCKNSEHWYRDRCRCFLWYEDGIGVFEDGFCNYAERRQE